MLPISHVNHSVVANFNSTKETHPIVAGFNSTENAHHDALSHVNHPDVKDFNSTKETHPVVADCNSTEKADPVFRNFHEALSLLKWVRTVKMPEEEPPVGEAK